MTTVDFGEMPDISGVVGKDGVHSFWLALMRPDNGFIGEKSVHGLLPPFLPQAAAGHCVSVARCCSVFVRTSRRSGLASGAGSSRGKPFPASAPHLFKVEELMQALEDIEKPIDYYDIILPPDAFKIPKDT